MRQGELSTTCRKCGLRIFNHDQHRIYCNGEPTLSKDHQDAIDTLLTVDGRGKPAKRKALNLLLESARRGVKLKTV